MSWHDDARLRFPHLAECTYLNTAAVGLGWVGQGAAAAEFHDGMMRDGYDAREVWRERSERARTRIAALLGVAPGQLVFTGNTTEAMNLVAASLTWRTGDRVIVAADEFPSVLLAWAPALRAGGELVTVPIPDEADRERRLIAALEPGVRVLAVSHVHWESGTRVDLGRLGAACRANGTLLCVDGIQALGAVPVDASQADAYCAATFKWLLSGFGLAVLAVGERLQAQVDPAVRGYLNAPPSRSLQAAHVNHPALCVLDATLGMLDAIGWPRVFSQVDMLSAMLHRAVREAGFDASTPFDARAGIVAVRVADPVSVAAALGARGVRTEQRGEAVRASTHFYNSPDEVGHFVDVLRESARPAA
jgi:cysteine desulfurase/selenocysteine lyase